MKKKTEAQGEKTYKKPFDLYSQSQSPPRYIREGMSSCGSNETQLD